VPKEKRRPKAALVRNPVDRAFDQGFTSRGPMYPGCVIVPIAVAFDGGL
jgi:hypothetical protein